MFRVGSWPVWELPARALSLMGLVHVAAALVLVLAFVRTPAPPTSLEWAFALVALGGLALSYVAERVVGSTGVHASNTMTVQQDGWALALALLLPTWLGMSVIALSVLGELSAAKFGFHRIPTRPEMAFKQFFNLSLWMLGVAAARAVWLASQGGLSLDEALSSASSGALVLAGMALAGATFLFLMEMTLVCVVSLAAHSSFRELVAQLPAGAARSVQSLAVGALAALAWSVSPPLVLFIFPLFLALQRALIHEYLLGESRTDAKTGLANAEFWRQSADAQLTRTLRGGAPMGVLIVDLDHFKRVNDTHGHLGGDEVLREVASRLRSTVGVQDLVGRFGGEEFVVLVREGAPAAVSELAERLRAAVAAGPVVLSSGVEVGLSCSIGLATLARGEDAALSDLLGLADGALYRAKRSGRNRVECALLPGRAA